MGPTGSFQPENLKKLFKVIALEQGEWSNGNIKASIEDLRYSDDPTDQYGGFTLVIRKAGDTDNAPIVLESFSNLNLNPQSPEPKAKALAPPESIVRTPPQTVLSFLNNTVSST